MDTKLINKKLRKIPPKLLPEVLAYIDSIVQKHDTSTNKNLSFNFSWEGGLADLSQKYNSVDLQHKSLNWR